MKVLIRADASSAIGIGHLSRCYALAEVLLEGHDEVTLLTSATSEPLSERWKQKGASVRLIRAAVGTDEDAIATASVTRSLRVDWLVLDGYAFDRRYRVNLDLGARLLLVDDHGAAALTADLITNGNIYASPTLYPDADARLLLGARFAMLRREFRETPAAERRSGVLVSLGGSDPNGHTLRLLEALSSIDINGSVVIGPRYGQRSFVRETARKLGWATIDAPEHMATVLGSCEVAVVGAGLTTLEAIAMRTPMVAVVIADNQVAVGEALTRLGLALVTSGDSPEATASAVGRLLAGAEARAEMSRRSHHLMDGRGAIRVASAMREDLLELRPATLEDAGLLLDWHNDPATRAASFRQERASQEGHLEWLRRALDDEDRVVAMGEMQGKPVGVVRLDRVGDRAVISVTVSPDMRSAGLAAPLIRRGTAHARALGIVRIDALIRPENVASRRAFASAGYVPSDKAASSTDGAIVMIYGPGER